MSFVPATANRDLWVVLGAMIGGALLLVWSALRGNGRSNEPVSGSINGATDGDPATPLPGPDVAHGPTGN